MAERASITRAKTLEAIEALRRGDLDATLHYSARSAKILFALARAAGLDDALCRLRHLCLSVDVAVALPEAARGMVAATPTEVGLVGLLSQTEPRL